MGSNAPQSSSGKPADKVKLTVTYFGQVVKQVEVPKRPCCVEKKKGARS